MSHHIRVFDHGAADVVRRLRHSARASPRGGRRRHRLQHKDARARRDTRFRVSRRQRDEQGDRGRRLLEAGSERARHDHERLSTPPHVARQASPSSLHLGRVRTLASGHTQGFRHGRDVRVSREIVVRVRLESAATHSQGGQPRQQGLHPHRSSRFPLAAVHDQERVRSGLLRRVLLLS